MEYVLNKGLPYVSGPQWLADHVLQGRWVLAVAGTHGKTTTSSMLAWVLEHAGMSPGFLIGGVPQNFSVSARLGGTPFFVVEADEYDSAFFDKRSKFVHYHPVRRSSIILSSIMRISSQIWRPSSGSSTIWCEPSLAKAWSSTPPQNRPWSASSAWVAGRRCKPQARAANGRRAC